MPLVSIITPTFNREQFHNRILSCVRSQTFKDVEWLVLDDSPRRSEILSAIGDPNVRYQHIERRITIGAKRNMLLEQAKGDIIMHFDDDDFYSPNYIESMLSAMKAEQLDFVNLQGWFLLDKRNNFFGYWNLLERSGNHFICLPHGIALLDSSKINIPNVELGWGFGYAYRKQVWSRQRFADVNHNEELVLALHAHDNNNKFKAGALVDKTGLCLHVVHRQSASICAPQYVIPTFMLQSVFQGYQEIE